MGFLAPECLLLTAAPLATTVFFASSQPLAAAIAAWPPAWPGAATVLVVLAGALLLRRVGRSRRSFRR